MQEEVRRIRADSVRGFPISEKESESISNWIRSHNCPDANCKCGSQLTYTFSPTSIGTFGEVQCSCGAKFEFRKVVWPLRKSCGWFENNILEDISSTSGSTEVVIGYVLYTSTPQVRFLPPAASEYVWTGTSSVPTYSSRRKKTKVPV